jgi:hypothetical protein
MAVLDGWPSARFGGCTEPGLQANSPAALNCVFRSAADPWDTDTAYQNRKKRG